MNVSISEHTNDHVERDVLGCVLFRPDSFYDLQNRILREGSEIFYRESHQRIWRVMTQLVEQGEVICDASIVDVMIEARMINRDDVGSTLSYLSVLKNTATSSVLFEKHIDILSKLWMKRRVITMALNAINCVQAQYDVVDVLSDMEAELMALTDEANHAESVTLRDAIKEHLAELDSNEEHTISTGFPDLDYKISNLRGDQLTALAARPGMGKTAAALQMASNIAIEQDHGVALISLEMKRTQLAMRMVCQRARVDSKKVMSRMMGEQEWARYMKAAAILAKSNVHIVDSYDLKLESIVSQSRRLVRKEGVKVIFIDHLGLIEAGRNFSSRVEAVANITRTLKRLTKELNVPIILLCQLNRDCEKRKDKRPMMSDLRESGSIEQDVSVVAFLYNDERYNPNTDDKGITEWLVEKSRDGTTGKVRTKWFAVHTRFESISKEY